MGWGHPQKSARLRARRGAHRNMGKLMDPYQSILDDLHQVKYRCVRGAGTKYCSDESLRANWDRASWTNRWHPKMNG